MSHVTLQSLALPEPEIGADPLIYMRADDGVRAAGGRLRMMPVSANSAVIFCPP